MPLRQLSTQERARAFASTSGKLDLEPYLDAVREMEGDVAYAIAFNGVSARAVKIRMRKAARQLGLKLRFGRVGKDATDAIVELVP